MSSHLNKLLKIYYFIAVESSEFLLCISINNIALILKKCILDLYTYTHAYNTWLCKIKQNINVQTSNEIFPNQAKNEL